MEHVHYIWDLVYWWRVYSQKQQDEFGIWLYHHIYRGNDPKHALKADVFKPKKWVQCCAMAESVTGPESSWARISPAEGKKPPKQTRTEDRGSKDLVEHHQSKRLLMSMGSRLQEVIDCKGIKNCNLWLLVCPITFGSLKRRVVRTSAVITTLFNWFGCKYPQISCDRQLREQSMCKYLLAWLYECHSICGWWSDLKTFKSHQITSASTDRDIYFRKVNLWMLIED